MRETITDICGRIYGYIEESNSKLVAKNLCGKILGYYDPRTNYTTNFAGKNLFKGNCLSALILKDARVDINL